MSDWIGLGFFVLLIVGVHRRIEIAVQTANANLGRI